MAKKTEKLKEIKIIPPVAIDVVINLLGGNTKALLRWAKINYAGKAKSRNEWLGILVNETVLSKTEALAISEKFKF